jgi:hypothetical protein
MRGGENSIAGRPIPSTIMLNPVSSQFFSSKSQNLTQFHQ